jgi:DNA recombination protein RmuC
MATAAVIISAITLLVVLLLFLRLFLKREEPGLLLLQDQVSSMRTQVDMRLQQIYDIGKDIASLQELLKPPKLRGILGESLLHDLLAQCLPEECFALQHRFQDGTIVDALIRLPSGLVPVDAKFPLEHFQEALGRDDEEASGAHRALLRDVRKMVDNIAQKYIQPQEGTLDFALMYIPAESVYYEVAIKHTPGEEGLMEYSLKKKVFLVSPATFYAYLQSISLGLKGLQIEQNVRQVLDGLAQLRRNLDTFEDEFLVLGTHLRRAQGKYEDADGRLRQLDSRLGRLEGGAQAPLPPGEPTSLDIERGG